MSSLDTPHFFSYPDKKQKLGFVYQLHIHHVIDVGKVMI